MKKITMVSGTVNMPATSLPVALSMGEEAKITDLKVNYMESPIGIDTENVTFSWKMESDYIGKMQSGYEIKVWNNDKTLWEVCEESGGSVGIPYGGEELSEGGEYFWRVKVTDADGQEYISGTEKFETGITNDNAWRTAKFIALEKSSSAPIFKRTFNISDNMKKARLYVTAIGTYEAEINGEKVYKMENGEKIYHHMNPGYDNGHYSMTYQTYDVTELINSENAIVLKAAHGWRNASGGNIMGQTSGQPGVKALLRIEYENGQVENIATNISDWKGTLSGPVTASGIYYGEDYDARRENEENYIRETPVEINYSGKIIASRNMEGRFVPEFDQNVKSYVIYNGTKAESTYAGGEINVVAQGENFGDGVVLKKGETMVVNMGQNLSAVPYITFSGEAGKTARLKMAEMLNDGSRVGNGATDASGPKGSIYTKSLRGARSEVHFIFASDEKVTYTPTMSYFGYQYVQITADCDITIYSLISRAISSVSEQTGFIETNNKDVNRLFLNALYGQLSNFFTIPTDCNQRDERLSWTGDIQAFSKTANYNFNSAAFLSGYQDILTESTIAKGYPSAVTGFTGFFDHWAMGWSDAVVINAWILYEQTGDKTILIKNYDAFIKYMEYMKSIEREAYQAPGIQTRAYGDWLALQGTGYEVIADYYYGYVNLIMSDIAYSVGDNEKAKYYLAYFEKIKEKFLQTHVEFDKGIPQGYEKSEGRLRIKSGVGSPLFMNKGGTFEDNSQTSLLWMLKLGFYDSEEMKNEAIRMLVENIRNENPDVSSTRADYGKNSLSVGFLGTNVIAPVLTDTGQSDVSYDLLLNTCMPSWLFEVRAGATTIWERWNSYTPGVGFGDSEMNSFNHFSYGSVCEWMYEYMAGISPQKGKGFKEIILQPTFDTGEQYNDEERIHSVRGTYKSFYGEIISEWETDDEGRLVSYGALVPANTTATLYLPADEAMVREFENIPGVTYIRQEIRNGFEVAVFKLKSGSCTFTVKDGILLCETDSVVDVATSDDN